MKMAFMKDLKKMNMWMKLLFLLAFLLLLWGLFWPRQKSYMLVPMPQENFREHMDDLKVSSKPCVAMFYAPWCGYCKKAMPEWDRFASSYNKCNVVKVNCDEHKELGKRHGVKSYPTIKFLPNGLANPEGAKDFDRNRTMNDFVAFADECVSADPSVLPNQAAALSSDVPPYRAGQGPLTTSFVARNFGLE